MGYSQSSHPDPFQDKLDASRELLAEIHRNLTMGSENLTNVLPMVRDKFLTREITFQLEEYAAHTRQAVSLMSEYGVTPEKTSLMKSIMAKGGIALNTLIDSSDGHIAEMIRRGTNLGASQLAKTVDRMAYRGCDDHVVQFGRTVVNFERTGADRAGEYAG
ncbi:MAG: hypothetical protein IJ480_02250 [Clostridia bacterium]|nr:hypothetical protein [Clostridia bacterium]